MTEVVIGDCREGNRTVVGINLVDLDNMVTYAGNGSSLIGLEMQYLNLAEVWKTEREE